MSDPHAAERRGEGCDGPRALRSDQPALRPREPRDDRSAWTSAGGGGRSASSTCRRARVSSIWPVGRVTSAANSGAPGYLAVGFDFAFGMLAAASTDAPLVQADALRLPVRDASADGVTCGFALRNVVSLPTCSLSSVGSCVPGGAIALLDASRPDNARASRRPRRVLRAGRADDRRSLSDRDAYAYLPKSMAYLPAADRDARDAARRRASHRRGALQLSGGITQLLVGVRA